MLLECTKCNYRCEEGETDSCIQSDGKETARCPQCTGIMEEIPYWKVLTWEQFKKKVDDKIKESGKKESEIDIEWIDIAYPADVTIHIDSHNNLIVS